MTTYHVIIGIADAQTGKDVDYCRETISEREANSLDQAIAIVKSRLRYAVTGGLFVREHKCFVSE